MAWNREEFKAALRKRIEEKGSLERNRKTIGAIPMGAVKPLIDVAAEVAHVFLTPEPGERTDQEVLELIAAGNRMATKLTKMVRSKPARSRSNADRQEYTEVRRLVGEWDRLLDEDDDDDDIEEEGLLPLTQHPHLRVKDWEQIWYVMTGGQIKDYDGFTDVGVEQTMTVEEFMERVVQCTISLNPSRAAMRR